MKQRYGLRKLSIGAVSCLLGSAIYFSLEMNVQAQELENQGLQEDTYSQDNDVVIETDGNVLAIDENQPQLQDLEAAEQVFKESEDKQVEQEISVLQTQGTSAIVDAQGKEYASVYAAISDTAQGLEKLLILNEDITETITLEKDIQLTIRSAEGSTHSITGNIVGRKGQLILENVKLNGYIALGGTETKAEIRGCEINNPNGNGIMVNTGAEITSITDTDITAYSYGIRISADTGYTNKIGTISNCTIQTISNGSTSSKSTGAILLDGGWNIENCGLIIDTIENCHLICNGVNLEDAGIQIYRTRQVDSQEIYIGTIKDTKIECFNGASGIFVHETTIYKILDTNIHTNINSSSHSRNSNGIYHFHSYIDVIDNVNIQVDGNIGTGIYAVALTSNDYSIGHIRKSSIEGYSAGINNTGHIKGIEDSTFKSRSTSTSTTTSGRSAAILALSGGIGYIRESNVESGSHGLFVSSGVTIGDITNTNIQADYKGIYIYGAVPNYPSSIKSIVSSTVKAKNSYAIQSSNAYIGSIEKSTIETHTASSSGIAIYNGGNANIDRIEKSNITGYAGILGYGTSANGNQIQIIRDNVIETTGAGIQLTGSVSKEIINNKVTGINAIIVDRYRNSAGTVENNGQVDEISNNTIIATNKGISIRTNSNVLNVINNTIQADRIGIEVQNNGGIETLSQCSIQAGTYGLDIKDEGKIITLSDNTVTATSADAYEAIIVRSGGKIDTIVSGTYTGKNHGANIQSEATYIKGGTFIGESGNGVQIVGDGNVSVISGGVFKGQKHGLDNQAYLKTITGAPIFYGKNGYAIYNEFDKSVIELEPELSQELKGYARYYGNKGEIYDVTKIKFPTFTFNGIPYAMSALTEEVLGVQGVPFHYLTVPIQVLYDGNGADQGDMSLFEYNGEYRSDLVAQTNQYVKNGYAFMGWNTKKDGTGDLYQEGDILDIKDAQTTLFAQWAAKYNVTVLDDGNGHASANPEVGLSGTQVQLFATSNLGYHFKEWQILSGNVVITEDTFVIADQDVTIKAIFEQNEYLVTFNSNGGSEVDSQKVKHGNLALQPINPVKAGFVFKGWFLKDSLFDFDTPIIENVELLAKWEEVVMEETPQPSQASTPKPERELVIEQPQEKEEKLTEVKKENGAVQSLEKVQTGMGDSINLAFIALSSALATSRLSKKRKD